MSIIHRATQGGHGFVGHPREIFVPHVEDPAGEEHQDAVPRDWIYPRVMTKGEPPEKRIGHWTEKREKERYN